MAANQHGREPAWPRSGSDREAVTLLPEGSTGPKVRYMAATGLSHLGKWAAADINGYADKIARFCQSKR